LLKIRKRQTPELTIDAINALFAPLAGAKGMLVAVYGGPDSTALLLMTALWSRGPERPKVAVATVDHAMRPGSTKEAEAVGALCRRLGLAHHLLTWRGEKPASRIQERAREARYSLLADCARSIGANFLVTAHHADDQAETILFRLLRGSGIAGLAGMPETAERDGVFLARPLLSLGKADLVAYCEEHGQEFARDPSNDDPRFARTRLRTLTKLLAAEGLGAAEFARLARRAALMEEAVKRQTETAMARLSWMSGGACDAHVLFREPREIVQRLLAARIAAVAGNAGRLPNLEQMEKLAEALSRSLADSIALKANIGGVSIELNAEGQLSFEPESPRKSNAGSTTTNSFEGPKT
jgi:tRNA(Ile)-lysidine synthase